MVSFAKRYFILFALAGMALLSVVQYADADSGSNTAGSNSSVQNLNTGEFFGTIQAAVDAASDGATIVVYPGTYAENVDVYRKLTIKSYSGNPLDTVIRTSSSGDHVFYVNANNVKISGFTISGANQNAPYSGIYLYRAGGCTIENNIISGNWYGITLDNSTNNVLVKNTVNSNSDTGIYLVGSVNNKLTGNTVASNYQYGIWLRDSSNSNNLAENLVNSNTRSGFLLDNQCIGNTLVDNVADANRGHGIYLNAASNSNSIQNNTVSSNSIYGIYLSSSGDNRITGNNRIINNGRGICLSNSNYNRIFNNYFSNSENTYFEGSNTGNSWNTSKTEQVNIVGGPYTGGNFWAKPDSTGLSQTSRDLTGDGFLDAQYDLSVDVDAAQRNVDYLPLARTVIVAPSGKKGYTRIQDAVNAAESGYSIAVYPGTYRENLDLTKGVAIAAISGLPENTVVTAGNSKAHVFNVRTGGAVISGFSITGATGADTSSGVYLDGATDCILSNNLVSKNSIGICLSNSERNTLLSNRMSSNNYNFKDSGTLQNEIDTSNTVEGKPIYYLCSKSDMEINSSSNAGTVYCIGCNNITVKNLVLKNNPRGISFYNTGDSRILNNAIQNNFDGIYLEASSGNVLDGNTVNKSANNGISLSGSASNTIANNFITENGASGMSLSSSGDNLIYNNYFNNANNVNLGTDNSNVWNTAATAGVNIVSGPMLGGNYWAIPEGTGFSQTCTEVSEDSICKLEYAISQNNIDSLPLSNPVQVLPLVNFFTNVTGGLAPLPVQFTAFASSRVWPVQWSWSFGDGSPVEKGQNSADGTYSGSVSHIYNSSGEYIVNLAVSNSHGAAYKTSQIFVAKPIVSSLSIGKYVVSLDENSKEIVINPGYGNIEVVDKAALLKLSGINLYIFSENGFEIDENGNLKGKYQYTKLEKTQESAKLGNLTAVFSFNASFDGGLSALLDSNAGISCGVVPGAPGSSIEQAYKDSLASDALSLNRAAYSLIIEKKGLDGIDISDVNVVMTVPSDYVNTDGGPEKFIIMSWVNGGAEKLTTTRSTAGSSSQFTGLSSGGFSSESSFVASLLSLTSAVDGGSGDGGNSGGGSSGGGGSSSGGGGGGGGSVSPEDQQNVEIKELSQQFVVSGAHVKFEFPRGVTSVGSVEFDAKKSFGKVNTFVEMLKGQSTLVPSLPEGKVYKNLNIWVGSGGIITPENIKNAFISFKVDRAWILDNNVDLSAVTLYRYSEGSWNALPTTLVREDGAFYYFKAETPGFSPFSIVAPERKAHAVEAIPFNEVPRTVVQAEQSASEMPEIAGIEGNETESSSGKWKTPLAFVGSALVIGLVIASRVPEVRNKVRSIISGENELYDFMDEDKFSENGDEEANTGDSTADEDLKELKEQERIIAEQEKTSFRDYISQLHKKKP